MQVSGGAQHRVNVRTSRAIAVLRTAAKYKMNRNQRLGLSSPALIVVTLLCIFTVFGLCLLLVSSVITGSGERVESTQRRLLYATNPSLLMDACRELATRYGQSTAPIYPDPTSSSLPPIIQRVRPKTITIDNGRVTLECGTNVYRFGLVVDASTPPATAPTTSPSTRPAPPMATRTLAPGVWYYAEDRAVPEP
jgi:hypothetical protein